MKKILESIILVFLMTGILIPGIAEAIAPPARECTLKHVFPANTCTDKDGNIITTAVGPNQVVTTAGGLCCVIDAIYTITDWVFYVIFTLSIVMIVIGGGIYITAAGDPAKTEQGRGIIKYSIIGLIIALLAKMFPVAVRTLTGL